MTVNYVNQNHAKVLLRNVVLKVSSEKYLVQHDHQYHKEVRPRSFPMNRHTRDLTQT